MGGVEDNPLDDLALFAKLKGWVKSSQEDHADWYKEARECFAFVAGRSLDGKGQWPGTSWDDMVNSGRQPIEFNRTGPIVDAVCGLEVNNRQEIKYLPRTDGDVTVDERLSSLAKWARDEAQAEDEESAMFRDAVISGRGWTETRLDFDEEPLGKIIVEHLDPLECGVDPAAKKANFEDARFQWRMRDLPTDEAQAMFEGVLPAALDAGWAKSIDTKDGGPGNKTDYPDETRPGLLADNAAPKTVRLVQIEWWDRVKVAMVAMPGAAEPQEMSEEAWTTLKGESEGQIDETGQPVPAPTGQIVQRRVYRSAFLGRNSVLAQTDKQCFNLRACTGRYDRVKGYHYGVVRPMRDPQMMANKTLSQVLHILNTNAKGGIIYEDGVFANARDAERDWSNPSKSVKVKSGMLDKLKDRTAPALPTALTALQEFSLSSIRDVTGVSVEMLGLADREQAASLEYQRRQSAMTILAPLFDGLRRYRKMQGRTLLEALKLLPPGVLVRVLIDPEEAQAEYQQQMAQWQQIAQQAQQQGQQPPPQPEPPDAEFMKQTTRGYQFDPNKFGLGENSRFDVIVDETPTSPNQKEATWAAIQPFMAQLPPTAVPIALKYSPLPETAAKELGDAISKAGEGPQVPPELQQQIQQGQQQIEQLTNENQQLKSDATAKLGKLQVDGFNAETKRMQAEQPNADNERLSQLEQMVELLARNQHAIITTRRNHE